MHAHGEDTIADNDAPRSICAIEKSQRVKSTRPMARSAKIIPAPGARSHASLSFSPKHPPVVDGAAARFAARPL